MTNEAWVIITRHPDYATEVEEVCGPPVNEIILDMGADFDGTPDTAEEAEEWFAGLLYQAKGAPETVKDRVWELIDEYSNAHWVHLWEG